MFKRFVAVILSFAIIVSILPVLSFSSDASNSGFVQIRVYYRVKVLDDWGIEQSAIITEDGCLMLASSVSETTQIQITRFLVRNDSVGTGYFQFDINAGGLVPPSGTSPGISYTSLAFSVNGGVTAYSFAATDRSDFVRVSGTYGTDPAQPGYDIINSSFNRTFFGKVDGSGYITFNTPVTLTLRQNSSLSPYIYLFFRHVIIGYDNSSYLSNMEQYLSSIDSNVDSIAGWMEEEHNLFDDSWSSGGGDTYSEYTSDNSSLWGTLRDLFGFSIFGSLWTLDIFSTSNSLFSSWFSQTNSDNINGPSRRSPGETEYIDYFQKNLDGELDVFGLGGETQ